jgi:hypothetical protein
MNPPASKEAWEQFLEECRVAEKGNFVMVLIETHNVEGFALTQPGDLNRSPDALSVGLG